MSQTIAKGTSMGRSKSGLSTVGYTIYNADGTENQARTTVGVAEIGSTGIYRAQITFSDTFIGYVVWDTGDAVPVYTMDQIHYAQFTQASGSGGGGYAIIETWDRKEKEKIINDVEKILNIVKEISSKGIVEVNEAIVGLKNIYENNSQRLREVLDLKADSIVDEVKKNSDVNKLNENLEVIASALEALIEYQEFKQIVEEVGSHVDS